MPEYLISVYIGFLGESKVGRLYSKKVKGEPLVIPGFEQVELFISQENSLDDWAISERKTGFAIVKDCFDKEGAIRKATKLMEKNGLAAMLKTIAKYESVETLPPLPDNWRDMKPEEDER